MRHSSNDERSRFLNRLKIGKGYLILDAGTGSGDFAILIGEKFKEKQPWIVAIDFDLKEHIKDARNSVKEKKLADVISIVGADLRCIPIKGDCIDNVVSYYFLSFVPSKDLCRVAHEMHRVLKTSSPMLMLDFHPKSRSETQTIFLEMVELSNALKDAFGAPYLKVNFHDPRYLKEIFGKAGFRNVCYQIFKNRIETSKDLVNFYEEMIAKLSSNNRSRLCRKLNRVKRNLTKFGKAEYTDAYLIRGVK